jgi:FixJ family two-component response regulator
MAGLTPRQREVARLAAGGLRNREIATKLGISEKTVKAHILCAAKLVPGDAMPRHRLTFFLIDEEERHAA